jgi:hypothetical protein
MVPSMAKWACGREPPLGFDAAEVLEVGASCAADVLPEPVEQRKEVDRVPRRMAVVIRSRVDTGAVRADAAVAVEGERQEGGWLKH